MILLLFTFMLLLLLKATYPVKTYLINEDGFNLTKALEDGEAEVVFIPEGTYISRYPFEM